MKFITLTKSKLSLTFVLLFMSVGLIFGQAQMVKGIITGSDGEPLIGTTVSVKGDSGIGTISDIDGSYSIEVGPESTLVFSYTGFLTSEIAVNSQTEINVVLEEDINKLDEVIVIGYGKVSRRDLTGSVSSLDGDELAKVQSISFEQGLAARAAGVQVVSSEGGPGASMKIRIRGGTSINANNDPLYVVDGFPLIGSSQGNSLGLGNSSSSPLASIDPSDIESIEILKDASSTAIYGSRGANGVVLITTKSGRKGRTSANFETYFGSSELGRNIDLMSPQEYVDYWNEYFPWNPNDPNDNYTTSYRDELGNVIPLNDDRVRVLDWRDRVFKRGAVQSYRASMSGGTDKLNYSGSFGYINQDGIVNNSNFKRYSGNLKIDQNITKRLKAGINLNMGFTRNTGVVTAASEARQGRNGVITNVTLFTPVQGRVRYSDGEYDADGVLISTRSNDVLNPEKQINEVVNKKNAINAFGNFYAEYQLAQNLSIRSSLGTNLWQDKGVFFWPGTFGWGRSTNGRAVVGSANNLGWVNENTLNYNTKVGIHKIDGVVGFTQQGSRFESFNTQIIDFAIPSLNLDNLGSGAQPLPSRSTSSEWGLYSFLGRANYVLSDKYIFTFTGRYDGSSRFAEGKQWGFFPSGAFAWRIGEENFIKSIDVISSAKARVSYGLSGNNQIGTFRSLSQLNVANYVTGSTLQPGISIGQLANRDLTWETTTQLDAGFELGLFNDRVYFNFDYYVKNTKDLLLAVPIPLTSGFDISFKNFGEVQNRGVELSLNTVNIKSKDFTWSTDFNISFNRNEVIDIGDAENIRFSSLGEHRDDYIVQVGQPLGSIYGFVWDGIYNYDDFVEFEGLSQAQREEVMADFVRGQETWFTLKEGVVQRGGTSKYRPGMIKFEDQNGDGIVDVDDRTILGNTQPIHFGGITNNFAYKNFDFSVLTTWSYGNKVYNNNMRRGTSTAIPFFNKYGVIRDRWTPSNPDTDIWGIWGDGDGGSGDITHSFFIEDGSYIRLSNITLGYSVPKSFLGTGSFKNIRIYGSVDNLHVFTNYRGFDPDVSVGFNQLTPGLDWDAYPKMRTFRVGVNAGF